LVFSLCSEVITANDFGFNLAYPEYTVQGITVALAAGTSSKNEEHCIL
jgi:hypothetical protein